MSERMITIPYEEYKELQTFKEIAQKNDDRIFVKNETCSYGNLYNWWEVYTKDDYVKSILRELNEYKKKEQESDSFENDKWEVPYPLMFWLLLCMIILYMVLQVIFR